MDLNLLNSEVDLKIDFEVSKPICRCCLSTERSVKNIVPFDPYFRELAGISVMQSDGLPQWLCWECIALLQKAVRFKHKVTQAHNLLYEYLTRCAPFPIDADDTELRKYASPHLKTTNTLVTATNGRGKNGFQEILKHDTPTSSSEFSIAPQLRLTPPLPDAPLLGKPDPSGPLIKMEDVDDVDFSTYEDDITLEEYRVGTNRLTDEDIKQLLEDPGPIDTKEEPEPKKKRKAKKKEEKGRKKKKTSNTETAAENNEITSKTKMKKNNAAYCRQREMANARKRRFLDNMTEEQREMKRAKDREYYNKKKECSVVRNIADMTEEEKRRQRKDWKEASRRYRERKRFTE